jgi:hypothetical protein
MVSHNNRIAAVEKPMDTAKWPTRSNFVSLFQAHLGEAYASSLKTGQPIAFMFIGQTEPTPATGLALQVVLAHPAEFPVAIENALKTAKAAGQIPDEVLLALAETIVEMTKKEGEPDENRDGK